MSRQVMAAKIDHPMKTIQLLFCTALKRFQNAALSLFIILNFYPPVSFCKANTALQVGADVLRQAYECRGNTDVSHQQRLNSCERLLFSNIISDEVKIEFRANQIVTLLEMGHFSTALPLMEKFIGDIQTLIRRGEPLPYLSKEALYAISQDILKIQKNFSDPISRNSHLVKLLMSVLDGSLRDKAIVQLFDALGLGQDSFLSLMLLLYAQKDEASAQRTIQQIISTYPYTPEAYVLRAALRADRASYEAAIEDLNKAIELNPKSTIARLLRATIAMQNAELETASRDLQAALLVDPTDHELIMLYADVASRQGHFEQATEMYEMILSALPHVAEARLARGKLNYRLSLWKEAERDFENLFGNDEVDEFMIYRLRAEARWRRGLVALARQDDRRALLLAEEALKREANNIDALFVLGVALLRLDSSRNIEQAISNLQSVVDSNPGDPDAWLWLGHAERLHGRVEAAIKAYDTALRLAPGWGDIWHGRGLALAAIGQRNEAEKAFARAVELGFLPAQETLSAMQRGHKLPQY